MHTDSVNKKNEASETYYMSGWRCKVVGVAVMVYMGVVKAVHLGHAGNIL